MSASGGNTNEMGIDRYTDQEIEKVLTGSTELDPKLADVLAELRSTAIEMPAETVAAHHITMAASEALLTAHDAEPAQARRRPRKRVRRKTVFASITSTLIGKILAGSVALAATGGTVAAATGNLPDPVQAVVSEAVDVVGIDLPHPDDFSAADDNPSDDDLLESDVATDTDDNSSDDNQLESEDNSSDDNQLEAVENENETVENENEAVEADEAGDSSGADDTSDANSDTGDSDNDNDNDNADADADADAATTTSID